jgi:hypothetical protein
MKTNTTMKTVTTLKTEATMRTSIQIFASVFLLAAALAGRGMAQQVTGPARGVAPAVRAEDLARYIRDEHRRQVRLSTPSRRGKGPRSRPCATGRRHARRGSIRRIPSVLKLLRPPASVDPNQPVASIATMQDHVGRDTAEPLFRTRLLAAFSIVALLLAALGIYGV